MKNKFDFKKDGLIWVMLILLSPPFGSCQKEELQKPLAGNSWKLIGFGNEVTGKVRELESLTCNQCFQVSFLHNGVIDGFTSGNKSMGHYKLKSSGSQNFSDFNFSNMSEAGETPDGYLFLDAMRKVYKYKTDSRNLFLYYDGGNYLLFAPKKD